MTTIVISLCKEEYGWTHMQVSLDKTLVQTVWLPVHATSPEYLRKAVSAAVMAGVDTSMFSYHPGLGWATCFAVADEDSGELLFFCDRFSDLVAFTHNMTQGNRGGQ